MQQQRTCAGLVALYLAGAFALPAVASPAPADTPNSTGLKAAEMVDLSPDNWAYPAIEVLVDRYHIMGGFPDKTFRGNQTV
ncbi:MAG: S-layer homology domain-containing protein, partial [Cyanobacteria bacterium REEB65]|nr:S-layer homology domain-containing protein [Cyanobacteria bacterium REEB65]